MFEDITVGLLWLVTTWIVVNFILGMLEGFRSVNTELRRQITQHLDEIIHRVREEREGDTIYWFDQDDNEFLAQGQTQQELIDVLKSRYPDHIFYLESHHVLGKGVWEPRKIDIAELVKNRP